MRISTWLSTALFISLVLNTGAGYSVYRAEVQNRQALAYPAEMVSYHLMQLARFSGDLPSTDWNTLNSRARIYDSIQGIIDYGRAAQRIPVRGLPRQVGQQLGELAQRIETDRDVASRLAFSQDAVSVEDKAKIQQLANRLRKAGWTTEQASGTPTAWTYGRDWSELNHALDSFLAEGGP